MSSGVSHGNDGVDEPRVLVFTSKTIPLLYFNVTRELVTLNGSESELFPSRRIVL